MKKNKKRKGFTLIELIAVIAILGILALIIVPRVSGYTGQAKEASKIANAKTIVNAAEIYNSDIDSGTTTAPSHNDLTTDGKIFDNTSISTIKDVLYDHDYGTDKGGKHKYMSTWPSSVNLPTGSSGNYSDLINAIASK